MQILNVFHRVVPNYQITETNINEIEEKSFCCRLAADERVLPQEFYNKGFLKRAMDIHL